MGITQEEYNSIQAEIDEVGKGIANINKELDRAEALLRSK